MHSTGRDLRRLSNIKACDSEECLRRWRTLSSTTTTAIATVFHTHFAGDTAEAAEAAELDAFFGFCLKKPGWLFFDRPGLASAGSIAKIDQSEPQKPSRSPPRLTTTPQHFPQQFWAAQRRASQRVWVKPLAGDGALHMLPRPSPGPAGVEVT